MKPFSIPLIKVLGLYLALEKILSVAPTVFLPNPQEILSSAWIPMLIASVAIPIIGGTILWFSAETLARKIHGNKEPNLSVADDDLVRAGTFLIGIYLLIQHFGVLIGRYASLGEIGYGSLIVLGLSLVMVLGSGVIGSLYNRVKHFRNNKIV